MLNTMVSRPGSILFPLVAAFGAIASIAVRARPADRGTFVTTLGRDTVALESFTRTPNRIEGDIVVRVPGTVLLHYMVDLTDDWRSNPFARRRHSTRNRAGLSAPCGIGFHR